MLDDTGRTDPLERIPSPVRELDGVWSAEWSQNLLEAALVRVKGRTNDKHYQIYFLHVVKEKSVGEVCRQLNVSRGQVYLAKLRVGRMVVKELRALRDSEMR